MASIRRQSGVVERPAEQSRDLRERLRKQSRRFTAVSCRQRLARCDRLELSLSSLSSTNRFPTTVTTQILVLLHLLGYHAVVGDTDWRTELAVNVDAVTLSLSLSLPPIVVSVAMGLGEVVASAVVCFASTNIDEALVLVVYFAAAAEGKRGFRRHHVWAGHLLGFTSVMLMSLGGAFVGSFLPNEYSGLLGFVPLFMGLAQMRHWGDKDSDKGRERDETDVTGANFESAAEAKLESRSSRESQQHQWRDTAIKPTSTASTSPPMHRSPAKQSKPARSRRQNPSSTSQQLPIRALPPLMAAREKMTTALTAVYSVHSLKVAAAAIANGGDNVAIYVPLLVTYSAAEVLITLAVFYALLLLLIFLADVFVSFRVVANFLERYEDFIVPVALVLLGVHILHSSDVLGLVCSSC